MMKANIATYLKEKRMKIMTLNKLRKEGKTEEADKVLKDLKEFTLKKFKEMKKVEEPDRPVE